MAKKKEKTICSICGDELASYQSLSKHVKNKHNISSQEYYDKCFGIGYCIICGNISSFNNINYGYYDTCSRSCAAKLFRKRLKEDSDKFNIFKEKVINNMTNYHKNLSDEDRTNRIKNISIGVKTHIETLTEEQRREKFGWFNKLNNEEKKIFIEKMLQTGCHRWKITASSEEIQEVRDRTTATLIKTWELYGEEIIKLRKETFIKNLQFYQNNQEDILFISQKTIDSLNKVFNIE